MIQSPEIRNIDIEIEDAKLAIKKLDMLQRLQNNADFRGLVEDAYFKEEASNVVLAKAIPHLREANHQKVFDNRIIGIGEFRQWLGEVHAQGEISRKALKDAESTRDEILDEE
jgi:hypothetical protein